MKVYYEKVGKKYVPVREYDENFLSSFSCGSYLVHVEPGSKSWRKHDLDGKEDFEILATLKKYEGAILLKISDAAKLKPSKTPYTKAQIKAWKALEKTFGGSICSLVGCSYQEVVDTLFNTIVNKIKKGKQSVLLMGEEKC